MTIKDSVDLYLLNGVVKDHSARSLYNRSETPQADYLSVSAHDTINPSDTMRQLVDHDLKCIKEDNDETVVYESLPKITPASASRNSQKSKSRGSRNSRPAT